MSDHYYKIDTAYHESSHVIVGSLYHNKIEYCMINENLDSGWTEAQHIFPHINYNEKVNNYLYNSLIYFNYAGFITDKRNFTLHTGSKKYPKIIKTGSSIDIKEISNIIIKYNLTEPGQSRNAFKQKMQRKTLKIVEQYWNDIVLMTHNLYNIKNNILYYDDIKNILIKQSENKVYWKKIFNQIDYLHNNVEDLISADFKDVVSF